MNSESDSNSEPHVNPHVNPHDEQVDSHDRLSPEKKTTWLGRSFKPFRTAMLRGIAVVLPPLLTIMLFAWAWNTIDRVILRPVEKLSENCVAWAIEDIRENDLIQTEIQHSPTSRLPIKELDGHRLYTAMDGTDLIQINNQWIPQEVYELAISKNTETELKLAHDYYRQYVQNRFLKRHLVIPMFLAIFLAVMYLVGKLLAAGAGRFFWHTFESMIHRLPLIRNVYSSVKQVTDFALSENEVQFTRVVAVEYPRKGIWSIGFVTGEGLLDIRQAAGEPMLSVLMPTSPMPATGFTIMVPKSETIDLNVTIDQAVQYCVSCGVVIPDHQMAKAAIEGEVRRRAGADRPDATDIGKLDSLDDQSKSEEK